MATHSSILAWEIPWTEEPGGLPSRGFKELDTTEHALALGKVPEEPEERSLCSNIMLLTVNGQGKPQHF